MGKIADPKAYLVFQKIGVKNIGQNVITRTTGTLQMGDSVRVMSRKQSDR